MNQVTVPYRQGYDFGMGVKGSSGDPRGLAVSGAITSVQGGGGGSGGFQLSRIQTTDDLESHLGISADASGGVGLFSGSARFSFARDCKVQSTSLILLLSATEQLGFRQMNEPSLAADAAALTSDGRADLFEQRYGDAFVRGMQLGGQFFGVIRIDTQSEESRRNIQASLQGSYGTFNAHAGFNFNDSVRQERASVDVQVYWEGGRVTIKPTNPEQLLAAAQEWTNTIRDQPMPYMVTLAPFVIARGPLPPNPEDLAHQHDVLIRCAKLRSQTVDKLNLVEYILSPEHRDEFPADPGGPDLAALQAALAGDLDLIAEAASYALDHPKEALDPETYARTRGGRANYALTALPANMPAHAGSSVPVPNFVVQPTSEAATKLAADSRLTLRWLDNGVVEPTWRMLSQDPPAGTSVKPGATVTITSTKTKANPRLVAGIHIRDFIH